MFIGAIVAGGGALLGAYSSRKATKSANEQQDKMLAAQQEAAKMDPRVEGMIFGNGTTDGGLLGRYKGMFDTPQSAGMKNYGDFNNHYLGGGAAAEDTGKVRAWAHGQMNDNNRAAPQMQAAQVNAPRQNALDTTASFDRFMNGDAGANPYLTRALQGAMDQSTNVFGQQQQMATENLQENILPGIRSNSVLTGQYGGSRQGIAEGNAIGDFAKAQQQTINQFGQNNTNAAVGAQAQSFNQGQDRALSATTNLSGQQYGVASQDASMRQQANATNLGAQMQQQNANDVRSQLGISNLQGLIGSAQQTGQMQDNYDVNRAGQINNLLAPYMKQSGTNIQVQQPYQSNTAGSMLGGAAAGLSLYNQFKTASTPPPPAGGSLPLGYGGGIYGG